MARFFRSANLPTFDDYRKYVPWLRVDFRYRCAYCERKELCIGGEEFFVVDHFRPRRFIELLANYENLYYSCRKCNEYKHDAWPSEEGISKGFRFSDPCAEDMYALHLSEKLDGRLDALTSCGHYTRDHIRLDRPALVAWRRTKRAALEDIPVLENALARLELLATVEVDDLKKQSSLREIAVLRRRIDMDRERFL
jgi:hypothetical protein